MTQVSSISIVFLISQSEAKFREIYELELNGLGKLGLNISIVTKKKLGNATKRNLCKRQFKNLLHQIVKELTLNFNYSYLILAKDNALKKDCFLDLKKAMFTEFNKIR